MNEQNRTPEASAFFSNKTAGKTRQNRRKQRPNSVDASEVQIRSFTSRESIKLRFPQPKNVTKGPSLRHIHKKMRVPTAPSFTKFHSARLTRTAESPRNPGAPAGRALAQNEFPSKTMGAPTARPFTLFPFSPTDQNGRVATEPRGRAQGLASQ